MDHALFESAEVSLERLERGATDLTDHDWAGCCMEAGMRQIQSGQVSFWVPRLALVAALRLGRADGFLPHYEHFLLLLDSTSKQDWYKQFSERGASGNLLAQSGRFAQAPHEFEPEFRRVVQALGPLDEGIVADVGCGGGLWAINLAKAGYRVIGTERFEYLVEAARRNAAAAGVGGLVEFRIDDICASALPAGLCARALCICVTPTLPDDAAFAALLHHLDRITRTGAPGDARRVIIGANRWGPSRMKAVGGILDAAGKDGQGSGGQYAVAMRRLHLLELCWWLHPRHLEAAKARFPTIELIGETHDRIDGTRADFLLK